MWKRKSLAGVGRRSNEQAHEAIRAKWHAPLFASLAGDGEQEIVAVAVFDSHAKHFADSA